MNTTEKPIHATLRNKPFRFTSLESAKSFSRNAIKPLWIIKGDDDKFWAVCPADFERLVQMGFESAI